MLIKIYQKNEIGAIWYACRRNSTITNICVKLKAYITLLIYKTYIPVWIDFPPLVGNLKSPRHENQSFLKYKNILFYS